MALAALLIVTYRDNPQTKVFFFSTRRLTSDYVFRQLSDQMLFFLDPELVSLTLNLCLRAFLPAVHGTSRICFIIGPTAGTETCFNEILDDQ